TARTTPTRHVARSPRCSQKTSNASSTPSEGDVSPEQSLYDAAGGRDGLLALAHAWHARCLADPVVSHAFSHGFRPDHSERLAAYWAQALGGPTDFTDSMADESNVLRLHSGNGPHEEMDRRALEAFVLALDDASPRDDRLRQVLTDYFAWGIGYM